LKRIGQNHAEILRCAQDDNHGFLAVSLAHRPSITRNDGLAAASLVIPNAVRIPAGSGKFLEAAASAASIVGAMML
jgi:hypothetical protein